MKAVRNFRELDEYSDLIAANKRISNILRQCRDYSFFGVDSALFLSQSERELYEQASVLSDKIAPLIRNSQHEEILRELSVLRDPIDEFFDDVMVMDEES